MFRNLILTSALLTATAVGFAAEAQAAPKTGNNSLVVVNGDTDRVVYDDGYDDAFCVTRRRFVGFDFWGNPIFRRVVRCR